jgi:hypothetical protein
MLASLLADSAISCARHQERPLGSEFSRIPAHPLSPIDLSHNATLRQMLGLIATHGCNSACVFLTVRRGPARKHHPSIGVCIGSFVGHRSPSPSSPPRTDDMAEGNIFLERFIALAWAIGLGGKRSWTFPLPLAVSPGVQTDSGSRSCT